jgi:hypothetical protein
MYLKLAVRNAKRSAKDYMLYLATMIVLSSLIMFSNFLRQLDWWKGFKPIKGISQ